MFSKHKTETSPIAKTLGRAARVFAAAIGDASAVHAVSALGRVLGLFGIWRVRVKEENAPQAEHQRGAKIDDLRE